MSIEFPSRPRRYASPLDRNGGAVSKPPSASTSKKKRKKIPGLRLSEDLRIGDPQDGEREAVAKSDASTGKTVKSDSEHHKVKEEPQLRAGPPPRRKQPQPAEDSDQQGSGAGVADVEGPDPETVNKTSDRIPPASRSSGGDRMGTTIEAKANEPLLRSSSGDGDGKGPPQTFHKRTPPEDFQETLRTSLRRSTAIWPLCWF